MDLRIVNNCNNNCLYCLEQSYRIKESFIKKDVIFDKISNNQKDEVITFYWWNPLLHPDFDEIIIYSKNKWFLSIWVLTNTYSLNKEVLTNLIFKWLNSIWFYFTTFDEGEHNFITNSWIKLQELLANIEFIRDSSIFYKAIIHVNKQNITNIYKDIYVLNKKYWVKNIEFINYFPFDRPYEKYRDLLEYDFDKNRLYIEKIFEVISKLNLEVNFIKFDKSFFWNNLKYYNFQNWILNQIWKEDISRLSWEIPFCFKENRCKTCFIKDNCKLLWINLI